MSVPISSRSRCWRRTRGSHCRSTWLPALLVLSQSVALAACDGSTGPIREEAVAASLAPSGTSSGSAYVVNNQSGSLSVIDIETNAVIASIFLGYDRPSGIVVTHDGSRIYVAMSSANEVAVVEAATLTVARKISVTAISPQGMVLTPDGNSLYVGSSNVTGDMIVIDTRTDAQVATIPLSFGGPGVTMSPDGSRVYQVGTGHSQPQGIKVIDTSTNSVVATIPIGTLTGGMTIDPNGQLGYVSSSRLGTTWVIDLATNTVSSTLPTPGIGGWAYSPNGSTTLISRFPAYEMVETATGILLATIQPQQGFSLGGVAWTRDEGLMYVVQRSRSIIPSPGFVSVFETSTYSLITDIPVELNPSNVAIWQPAHGCDQQFWRRNGQQDWAAWEAAGFSPGDGVDATFGTSSFGPDFTLLDAIRSVATDDELRIARFGTVALLNASHPDIHYPFTVNEVITAVQTADGTALWAMAEGTEDLSCPLN